MNKADSTKVEMAKGLYIAGFNKAEIGKALGLARSTINRYADIHDWEGTKIRRIMMETDTMDKINRIFQYQVECLDTIANERREKNEMIPFEPKDFDAILKSWKVVQSQFSDYSKHAKIVKDLLLFIKNRDHDLAKELIDHTNDFLTVVKGLLT